MSVGGSVGRSVGRLVQKISVAVFPKNFSAIWRDGESRLYGCPRETDVAREIHQIFIPTRAALWRHLVVDSRAALWRHLVVDLHINIKSYLRAGQSGIEA